MRSVHKLEGERIHEVTDLHRLNGCVLDCFSWRHPVRLFYVNSIEICVKPDVL